MAPHLGISSTRINAVSHHIYVVYHLPTDIMFWFLAHPKCSLLTTYLFDLYSIPTPKQIMNFVQFIIAVNVTLSSTITFSTYSVSFSILR